MSSRLRFLVLSIILGAAFLLRAWHPERMAIEHFDEGVYAANFFSGHLGNRYPDQHLYAPPLWPAVLEWIVILSGVNPWSVMGVNVVLGTALVAAVWWTTRTIAEDLPQRTLTGDRFPSGGQLESEKSDPLAVADQAGLTAAVLVAFNETMIEYSRAALTDIPLTLAVTLAVGTGVKAVRRDGLGWIAATAALTALAWWTKYNGWLPLAILGAGIGGWGIVSRPGMRPVLNAVSVWGAVVIAAVVMWSPVLRDLQQYGGYAAVAANHAGYVVGVRGWGESAWRHIQVGRHALTPLSFVGLIGAFSLSQPFWRKDLRRGSCFVHSRFTILSGLGLITAILLGPLPASSTICLAAVVMNRHRIPRATPAQWILAAWIIGLTVATPMYRPYPRLVLPLLTGLAIGAGIGLASVSCPLRDRTCSQPTGRFSWLPFVAYAALLTAFVVLIPFRFPCRSDRNGLRLAAAEIVDRIPRADSSAELDAVIYVLAEPGLYYHLAAYDGPLEIIAQPASNLGMLRPGGTDPRVSAYLVTGPHSVEETQQLTEMGTVESVGEFEFVRSDLVLLDEVPPDQLAGRRRGMIHLWRIRSSASNP